MPPCKLILRSFQSPGDVVMLTAAVRDLHAAHPGRFQTDVRTAADDLWRHNPHLTSLRENEPGVEVLEMHYPLIHQSNQRPFHFLHGFPQYLEQRLGVSVPVTRFHGDIHLDAHERSAPPPGVEHGVAERFWVLVVGGKYDFTAKWWNPECFQKVVDHFRDRICFVQVGEAGHWHPRLHGVIDLVGKTSLRDLVRLVHHADGVLCPVTLAMHLAAAVPTRPGRPPRRACVVVAGGREPPHWETYPNHQFISTNGAMSCCADGGCWKSRCQPAGDGDAKDRENLCLTPVQVSPELRIAKCMHVITPEDVIRRVHLYYQGGALIYDNVRPALATLEQNSAPVASAPRRRVLIEFRHGLGDAVQLTVVLEHLKHYHPDWDLDVAALVGKHSAFHGLCRSVHVLDRDRVSTTDYDEVFRLDWHESRTAHAACPSTKPVRCLTEVFRLTPLVEFCTYTIHCSDRARDLARRYLESVCPDGPNAGGRFPVVLLHYQGNTSGDQKDLPHDLAREVCEVIRRVGRVPVILDWDRRSPLPDGKGIHNPGADHELWGGTGTGDAEVLAALIAASELLAGVDSGPLHVAAATTTGTVGVWTQHHPVHYFDLADNVLHLVPGDHERLAGGQACLDYFRVRYRWRPYRQLYVDLPAVVEGMLTGEEMDRLANRRFLGRLSATTYGQRYYEEHRCSGLDYLGFGDWQRQYGRWLVESLALRGKRVLDVGCACGWEAGSASRCSR